MRLYLFFRWQQTKDEHIIFAGFLIILFKMLEVFRWALLKSIQRRTLRIRKELKTFEIHPVLGVLSQIRKVIFLFLTICREISAARIKQAPIKKNK